MKVLALFFDIPRPDEAALRVLEQNDMTPRALIFKDELRVDIVDRRMLQQVPILRRGIYKLMPFEMSQIIEAYFIQHRYDIVLSWYERAAYIFALLSKLTGKKAVPHVALCSWPGRGFKSILLRLAESRIDRFIMWSSVQRDILINTLKVSPGKVTFLNYCVDQKFFRPMGKTADLICSVGSEMRDFNTLLEALRGLEIPCHVAAGTLRQEKTRSVTAVESADTSSNVTVGKKSFLELRELYARSRFVVIPLLESETDNGITCILEAFAMGKPVICSRTIGQVDVIKEGETGVFVPVGDPKALREAILHLWNNPDEAERMGRNARLYVEQQQTLDKFVHDVKCVVEGTVASRKRN